MAGGFVEALVPFLLLIYFALKSCDRVCICCNNALSLAPLATCTDLKPTCTATACKRSLVLSIVAAQPT